MHLLLQARADVDCKDYYSCSSLDYAVQMSLVEPIHVLGHADCSLFDAFHRPRRLVLEVAVHVEEIGLLNHKPNIAAETVVDRLVDLITARRHRLRDLAVCTLPASELAPFYPHGVDDSNLIDENASRLIAALLYRGIPVPSALFPGRDRTTMYHHIRSSSRVAEKLWNEGFRDINGKDSLGLTPLMHMHTNDIDFVSYPMNLRLECVAWFQNKGANFYAKQDLALYYERKKGKVLSGSRQLLSATSLHFIAYNIGQEIGQDLDAHIHRTKEPKSLKRRLSKPSRRVFERVITDKVPDDCICACSLGGCKAFTLIARSSISKMEKHAKSENLANFWVEVKDTCDPLECSEFLRLMTFEELRLTHTCCHPFRDYELFISLFCRIGDQAHEIHDEEAADLQKLEELLGEFESKRIELDLPFLDFLKEYWRPRMDEVLKEGALDEEGLREIGVKVYESDSDFSEDSGR